MSRLDETLAMDRRRFLRTALTGGALLVAGGSLVIPRLFAADNTPIGKPGNVLLEIFADNGRDLVAAPGTRSWYWPSAWPAPTSALSPARPST